MAGLGDTLLCNGIENKLASNQANWTQAFYFCAVSGSLILTLS
jgi:hypothetical protein